MPEPATTYRIFISAAEPSGDAHFAGLIKALRKTNKNIDFTGVGGQKMANAGCQLLQNTADKAAMIYNAFTQVAHYIRLIKQIDRYFQRNKVDLVIVCDSPAFNFHVAKAAKKAAFPTLFYVAPQLWAWAPWRLRKLRKRCDKLCCILPFEQQWFSERNVDTVFVGNPLLDDVGPDLSRYRRQYRDFNPENARLALLPGSRKAETKSLWLPMQQIALRLKAKYPGLTFVTVAVDEARRNLLADTQIQGFNCEYAIASVTNTARLADLALVTSGSATLEVAAAGCPMVVMFQSSRILWHLLGSWLIRIKHMSLVNILAGKELVPEFMPYFTSIDPIVDAAEALLDDTTRLSQISEELINLTQPLAQGSAAEKTAQIAFEMLQAGR
jgi:lipid-A-disaccharide synthase